MQTAYFDLAADLAADSANGWSIGSFGAIGEFVRDRGEEAIIRQETRSLEVVTSRGGLRIAPSQHLAPIAWDSLSSDGESWGHSLAFCVPVPKDDDDVICHLGRDRDALRAEDAGGALFDLGVAVGAVRMCVRSTDAKLLDALLAAEGRPISQCEGLIAEILRAQPHRILLSSAGRIEVFQPIPPPDGHSPIGPHTHYLPRLASKRRAHSSNAPIPDGWQAAIMLHPPSPWRTPLGARRPFDPDVDAAFLPFLERFSLPEDRCVEDDIRRAIGSGLTPEQAEWPASRRGRAKARIVLRRMAANGDVRVRRWRAYRDHAPV